ncbi:unnamed protein product [Eruca vesicaria subsp. sativa]|uniref:Uncharacterized protein n=1 Tax=Eruca vesicaria subsp. sativa TaxID=29727 RepID=A0ABC8JLJ3_ERUVS|nr:unnamed protein product [Eruca vesicaria subsp. sativa]
MANSQIESGAPISLQELYPFSPFFKEALSLRVTRLLRGYSIDTAVGVIEDGEKSLKINTQHLRDARTGRNVDGVDMNLYRKTIELLRQFLEVEEDNRNMVK